MGMYTCVPVVTPRWVLSVLEPSQAANMTLNAIPISVMHADSNAANDS